MPANRSSAEPDIVNDDTKTPTVRRHESSYIFLMKDEVFESNAEPKILKLTHPRYNTKTMFMLDSCNSKLYEILSFDEPFHSWFVGERVKSDGKLQMSTRFDPIFLLLPLLRDQSSNKAVPLKDLLNGALDENLKEIIGCIGDLSSVADLKGPPHLKAYKYNQEKTLICLQRKVQKVCNVLKMKNLHVKPGAVAETFVASIKDSENIDEEYYLKYAYGIVSEYLQEDLSTLLEKSFNFKPEVIELLSNKRKSQNDNEKENESKRPKTVDDDTNASGLFAKTISSLQSAKPAKPVNISAKEKARQKAAGGTKSISSFFSKK